LLVIPILGAHQVVQEHAERSSAVVESLHERAEEAAREMSHLEAKLAHATGVRVMSPEEEEEAAAV
jgi:hypothetical protein